MKSCFITLLLMFLAGMSMGQDRDSITHADNIPAELKLQVYYFHLTHRCNTCSTIESELRRAILEHFKAELDEGILRLASIDCELSENEALAKEYDAYGATLAFTSYREGKVAKKTDLTNWAFSNIKNPESFRNGIVTKIMELIK
ncbi:MAG TPA: nitrophenyl compound nitroreductase subunit ArsF family protein [Bacteroidales bacterium]|nr:nitrophenyl compound nitroreductase subunit ArsF family protein [Bacteroidales bacterium]HSA42286.1 nitrophenyl compound nitroreductase subunit ArsF family protein [Bacteroidales bacterium]